MQARRTSFFKPITFPNDASLVESNNQTAEERLRQIKRKLPTKAQSKIARNLPLRSQNTSPNFTKTMLLKRFELLGIEDLDIHNYLNQLPDSTRPISGLQLYCFLKIMLKITHYKYHIFKQNNLMRLLFGASLLLETFIALRGVGLVNKANFHLLYALSEEELQGLVYFFENNKQVVHRCMTAAQIYLIKRILPYDRPCLHDVFTILSQQLHLSRTDFLAILRLSYPGIEALHKKVVQSLNENGLTPLRFRMIYLQIAGKLDEGLSVILQHTPFDLKTAYEFVEVGANPDVPDWIGNTILHKTMEELVKNENPDVCAMAVKEWVLTYHADINKQNNSGVTPWEILLRDKNPDHIPFALELLNAGADCTAVMTTADYYQFLQGQYRYNYSESGAMLTALSVKYNALKSVYSMATCQHINHKQVKVGGKINSGSFGQVFTCSLDAKLLAMKRMDMEFFTDFVREVGVMSYLQSFDHPNIIKYKGYHVDVFYGNCYIFMQLANASLETLYEKQSNRSVKIKYEWMKGMVNGIRFLHRKGFVHRDIKSENVLITQGEKVKIADFGLTEQVQYIRKTRGSRLYMPPELFDDNHKNTFKSDVFSLSFTMLELMSWTLIGELMKFDVDCGKDEFERHMQSGIKPNIDPTFPLKIKKLIHWGLEYEPKDRPSLFKLKKELETDVDTISERLAAYR